jgi:hypothetical protein
MVITTKAGKFYWINVGKRIDMGLNDMGKEIGYTAH